MEPFHPPYDGQCLLVNREPPCCSGAFLDLLSIHDKDKEGFKFENVGPTFSSFAVVTH